METTKNTSAPSQHELSYDELSPVAQLGAQQFGSATSKEMEELETLYKTETGKNSSNIFEKENFYSWVAKHISHVNRDMSAELDDLRVEIERNSRSESEE